MAAKHRTSVDWEAACIDIAKFRDYSMNPTHPDSGGKHMAFEALGWDLSTAEARAEAAEQVVTALRSALPPVAPKMYDSAYGQRYSTETIITGPNGNSGKLKVKWQIDPAKTAPRLITNWLEVRRKEQER